MTNSEPIDSRPTHVRWMIVLLLMGFAALGHFNRVSISVVGSERLIDKAGISEQQMGYVYSAFLAVYTVCMLPGGWLIGRFGPTKALTWMGLALGSCVVLTGVLGWLNLSGTTLWIGLIVVRGLAGAGSAPLHPAAARSVSLWMPLSLRSTANGLVTGAALLGIAFKAPAFGPLIDAFDWPLACVLSGGALILHSLVWRALATDHPSEHPRTNVAERRRADSDGATSSMPTTSVAAELRELMRNHNFMLLVLSYSALSYVQYLFFYWNQHYFLNVLKMSTDDSRNADFAILLAMAIGMMFGGACADALCRVCGYRWGRRTLALSGMGFCTLFMILGIQATESAHVVLWFALALGSLGACEGIFWATSTEIGPPSSGMAPAFINTFGNGVGLIAPVLTPYLKHQYGWNAAIYAACAICAVGAVLWLAIDAGQKTN